MYKYKPKTLTCFVICNETVSSLRRVREVPEVESQKDGLGAFCPVSPLSAPSLFFWLAVSTLPQCLLSISDLFFASFN